MPSRQPFPIGNGAVVCYLRGSGLVDQSQTMMVAASAMAEKKTVSHGFVAGGDAAPAVQAANMISAGSKMNKQSVSGERCVKPNVGNWVVSSQ
jgi:hypothetical protein